MTQPHTDFGFEQVAPSEKTRRVRAVFESVAPRYDLMNDLMSLGFHRWWKREAVAMSDIHPGQQVLDLAGGTGDMTRLIHAGLKGQGQVVLSDINPAMLQRGRDRLINAGIVENIDHVRADACNLPFRSRSFDRIIMAFGLRNVTDKQATLASVYDCLRYGGLFTVLEFSRPVLHGIEPLYDVYSFKWLPWLGEQVANDADSYRYLAESIRRHPDQETLANMLRDSGFARVDYLNLSGGIVALHRAWKL